jgi:hypothetical protein
LLVKDGNKVAHAALEFPNDFPGYQLQGFTICDDPVKGLFVLFPATRNKKDGGETKTWYFLRPTVGDKEAAIEKLEKEILDVYESMTQPFNGPKMINK